MNGHWKKGNECFERGDLNGAYKAYLSAPGNIYTHISLILIHMRKRDYERATIMIRRGYKYKKLAVLLIVLKAHCLTEMNRLDEAKACAMEASEMFEAEKLSFPNSDMVIYRRNILKLKFPQYYTFEPLVPHNIITDTSKGSQMKLSPSARSPHLYSSAPRLNHPSNTSPTPSRLAKASTNPRTESHRKSPIQRQISQVKSLLSPKSTKSSHSPLAETFNPLDVLNH